MGHRKTQQWKNAKQVQGDGVGGDHYPLDPRGAGVSKNTWGDARDIYAQSSGSSAMLVDDFSTETSGRMILPCASHVRCAYCGSWRENKHDKCPYCGASEIEH